MSVDTPHDGSPDGTTDQAPPAGDAPADPTGDLSTDDVFHLLQNGRRRNVLRYLVDADDAVRMRDVAEQVAAWEHDTSVTALTSDQRQRVYIPLYQNHLPKLSDADVIEYNQSRGVVKPTDATADLYRYLEATEDGPPQSAADHAWPRYYLWVAVVGALFLVAAAAEPFPAPWPGGAAVGAVILALFGALATVHGAVEA